MRATAGELRRRVPKYRITHIRNMLTVMEGKAVREGLEMKPKFKPMSKRCPKCNKFVFINSLQQTEAECPDCGAQFRVIHVLRRGVKLVEQEIKTSKSNISNSKKGV